MRHSPLLLTALVCALSTTASAQLTVLRTFSTSGPAVGCAYDPGTDSVWVYGSFATTLRQFSATGTILNTIGRPGGSANDADLEIAPVSFTLGNTLIPQGSLLYIDGENGPAEIYAIDPQTGAVLASLVTSVGNSHVVGGAFHPQRGTFFLLQDRAATLPTLRNLVAEVNPVTGQLIGSFRTTTANPGFEISYGDIDVNGNGNLMIVSSLEQEIGQYTPGGAWVDGHPLPVGVGGLSGIGLDETGCDVFTISSVGFVNHLAAACPSATTIGAGCGGNTLTITQLPWAGSSFRARATGLPGSSIALAVTGLTQLAQPIALNAVLPQALPGCNVFVPSDIIVLLPVVGGVVESSLSLPAGRWTTGFAFYHQIGALELGGSQQLVGVSVTDAVALQIGSY